MFSHFETQNDLIYILTSYCCLERPIEHLVPIIYHILQAYFHFLLLEQDVMPYYFSNQEYSRQLGGLVEKEQMQHHLK